MTVVARSTESVRMSHGIFLAVIKALGRTRTRCYPRTWLFISRRKCRSIATKEDSIGEYFVIVPAN